MVAIFFFHPLFYQGGDIETFSNGPWPRNIVAMMVAMTLKPAARMLFKSWL